MSLRGDRYGDQPSWTATPWLPGTLGRLRSQSKAAITHAGPRLGACVRGKIVASYEAIVAVRGRPAQLWGHDPRGALPAPACADLRIPVQ
jgi:hypothetical protein